MKVTTILFIFSVTLGLSIIEYTCYELLEVHSGILIEIMQKFSNHWLSAFSVLFGDVTSICFLVISGMIYLSQSREDGFLCVISAYLGAAISGVLKTLFSRPRPLWKYSGIIGIACPKDWGSPSGHSMAAGTPLILMLFILSRRNASNYKHLGVSACIFITALDRLYLGAHFFFQIILGYSFAALIASILIYLSEKGYLNPTEKRCLMISHIFLMCLAIIAYVCFQIKYPKWEDYWTENFENKCDGSINYEKAMSKNLSEGLLAFTIAGFMLGRFLIGKKHEISTHRILSLFMFWGVVYFSIKFEYTMKKSLWLICVYRYLIGIIMSYGLPNLLRSIEGVNFKQT